jgi:protein ImuB
MFGVILLRDFELQAALRHRPELRGKAVGVVGGEKAIILQASAAARAAGVGAGMSTSQALARCGELVLLERAKEQEIAAGQALLESGFACSPWVEETGAGICTFELRGARREHGKLAREAVRRLGVLDLDARAGVARNPDLALLAAHHGQPVLVVPEDGGSGFLAGLPLAALSPTEEAARILAQWGIHTLGELAALPREAVTERLGPEAFLLWERAAGRSMRLLRLTSPPAKYEEQIEFEAEIETLEPLLFMLRRFIEQLVARLDTAYRVPAELHLRLGFAQGGEHRRKFRLPAPTRQADTLFRVLHTHLEDLRAPSPIARLSLAAIPAISRPTQLGLFATALRDPNRFGETLARLEALAGPERVGSPILTDTHQPDAFRMAPPEFANAAAVQEQSGEYTPSANRIGLPLRRFRPPLAAQVECRGHAPARLASAAGGGLVRAHRGPYRLSGNWWEPAAGWQIEEWDVQLADGRLYRLATRDGGWFVEGAYD